MRSGRNIESASARAGILTLSRLLAIRERREQSLRRDMALNQREQAELHVQAEHCRAERQTLCQQLLDLTGWRGTLLPREFSEQKEQLHRLYQQERRQQAHISDLLAQNQQLAAASEQLRLLLQRNRLEQEKLRILIEDESNRY